MFFPLEVLQGQLERKAKILLPWGEIYKFYYQMTEPVKTTSTRTVNAE